MYKGTMYEVSFRPIPIDEFDAIAPNKPILDII